MTAAPKRCGHSRKRLFYAPATFTLHSAAGYQLGGSYFRLGAIVITSVRNTRLRMLGTMNFDLQKWRNDAEKKRQQSEEAVKINPEGVTGYRDLGWALYNLGRYREAEEPLRHAIGLNPGDYYTHYHLGLVLAELHRLDESETELLRSIQLQPNNADAHRSLGVVWYEQHRFEDAVLAYQEAIRLKPDYACAYFCLGATYWELSEQAKAIAAYREALRLNPRYVPAAANLGWLYFDRGEFAQSAELIAQAIENAPMWEANTPGQQTDFPRLYTKLGEALAKSGNVESALKQYRVLRRFDRIAAGKLLQAIRGKGAVKWPNRTRSR